MLLHWFHLWQLPNANFISSRHFYACFDSKFHFYSRQNHDFHCLSKVSVTILLSEHYKMQHLFDHIVATCRPIVYIAHCWWLQKKVHGFELIYCWIPETAFSPRAITATSHQIWRHPIKDTYSVFGSLYSLFDAHINAINQLRPGHM